MNKAKLNKLAASLMSPNPNMSKLHLKNMTAQERRAKEREFFNYEGRWNRALNKARKVIENRIKQGKPAFSPSPPRPKVTRVVAKPSPAKKGKKSNIQKMREKMIKKKPPVVQYGHGARRVVVVSSPPKITQKNLNAAAARLRQMSAQIKAARATSIFLPNLLK
jgi:hypothetical protein